VPCVETPTLLLTEEVQFLLLVCLETALLLVLIGGEFRQVALLLLLQTLALLRLVGAECGPVLSPPLFVQIVLIEIWRLSALVCRRFS
jgi:hypothetical protein